MKELRDIKLDLLMGNQNPIVDLFNEITTGIKIINCNVYDKDGLEFIYFVPTKSRKNDWIFYQDAKNGKFWCNFGTYWSFFESKGLEYLEIQSITKYLVEESLKREVVTPNLEVLIQPEKVEEALKREVATPVRKHILKFEKVEEALKREVATPNSLFPTLTFAVEEALKREVSTPKPEIHKMDSMVLDALKREVTTPYYFLEQHVKLVEDALKREIDKE